MSLSDKREEMFEWIKTQYSDKLGLDLIALIIDRIMQDDREAVRELKARNTITHEIDIDDINEIFGEKIEEAGV